MAILALEAKAWQPYFDRISATLPGKQAEIELASLSLGSQIEAEWLSLSRIAYDSEHDQIEIFMDGVDHFIRRPSVVYIDQDIGGLHSVEIIDMDGVRQIVKLRDPLRLPPPGT